VAKQRVPRYKLEVREGVFVESIFPYFEVNAPMPPGTKVPPRCILIPGDTEQTEPTRNDPSVPS
jgi:hypothetical protein